MRKILLSLAVAVLLCTPAFGEQPPEIADFLKKVQDRCVDNKAAGMRSFSARVSLLMSHDPKITYAKDKIRFTYAWSLPDKEDVAFEQTPKEFHDGLRKGVSLLWRDVSGSFFADIIGAGQGLTMTSEGGKTDLKGKDPKFGEFVASYDETESRFLSILIPRLKIEIQYEFSLTERDEKFRVSVRKHIHRDRPPSKIVYSGFRKVSGYTVPTVFTVETADTKTKFGLEYLSVNEAPAKLEEIDIKEIKAEITAFEKGWAKWSDDEKKTQMEALSELDHELASAAIANRGLRDRSTDVKVHAAKVLSGMKKDNVVPLLVSALKPNEDDIKTYIAIVWCLGEIGDSRAIDSLSKDWWNQKIHEYGITAARAKIDSLGKIRHKASIEALIDTFYLTRDDRIGEVKGNILNSLKNLTGQDFGLDRRAWKDWWKKNKASFRF